MGRWRKKPVEVEAVPVREALRWAEKDWYAMPQWLRDAYEGKDRDKTGVKTVVFANGFVLIATLEGEMRGDIEDWIIKGVKGELYPCKPDIFAATYEVVDSALPRVEDPPKLGPGWIAYQAMDEEGRVLLGYRCSKGCGLTTEGECAYGGWHGEGDYEWMGIEEIVKKLSAYDLEFGRDPDELPDMSGLSRDAP